jgi:hypothetical protein
VVGLWNPPVLTELALLEPELELLELEPQAASTNASTATTAPAAIVRFDLIESPPVW